MNSLVKRWYSPRPPLLWLPVSWLFFLLVSIRRILYRARILPSYKLSVPVVVVGNINVGGTGKTPMVAWLVALLKRQGYQPGIITRGYGGQAKHWPQSVYPDSDPFLVGDEPVLLAQRCACPIVAGPDRVSAARRLLQHSNCDIVISDDGLQHYRLRRDVELVVVDGERRFGNGYCLPAGPLREPVSRLKNVNFVIANGPARQGEFSMELVPGDLVAVQSLDKTLSLGAFDGQRVHAVAGIGNPARFFALLKKNGLEVIEHAFPDHHQFKVSDLYFDDELPVIMTEKDAVKCKRFTRNGVGGTQWYLPVKAQLSEMFSHRFLQQLKEPTQQV